MNRLQLRPAGPADLDGIVRIFLDCFRETYATRLPARVSEAFDVAEGTALWEAALADPARCVTVALVPGSKPGEGTLCGVIGFEAVGTTGWVHSVYVAPSAQNDGVGRTLLSVATRDLGRAGCTQVLLWVFEANTPSVQFYARNGWQPDGASRVEERFGENEIRLSRTTRIGA